MIRKYSIEVIVALVAIIILVLTNNDGVAQAGQSNQSNKDLDIPELQERLAMLKHETSLLEDERDIETLQRTYGYYVDKNLWQQIGDLFAADGTLEIGGRGVFLGRERAVEYLEWLGDPVQGRLYDHTQMQGLVHVSPDGKTAKGRWRALVFGGDHMRSSIFGDCIYENEYVKQDGVWKIAKLHAYFIMYTMWDQGWETMAWPNTRPEQDLPPDLPPSIVYDMYPGELTAPFHYDNPVTGVPVYPGTYAPKPLETSGIEQLAAEVLNIQNSLQKLDDQQQVERLQNAWGFYFDAREWDELASLYAQDASMERDQRGIYLGRERIREALDLFGEEGLQQGNVHNNMLYQMVIHIDDDATNAKARFRTLDMHGDYQGEATLGGGVYENTYIKEEGIWKIKSEHLYTTFLADYELGWSHGAMPVPGVSKDLPPDLPPSFEYQAFPTYYTFPFHYPNPVTGRDPLQ